MQTQENLLCQFLRKRPITKKMTGHAEDHSLVLGNDLLERQLIAERRPLNPIIEPRSRRVIQCDCSFPPHHALVRRPFLSERSYFG
jgi:hypothetical protein